MYDTLAVVDLQNHHYLTKHYPVAPRVRRPRDGDLTEEPIARRARATVDWVERENPEVIASNSLLEPVVGEDFDDDLAYVMSEHADQQEPTESQKRELLKIHRGLGHPQPNELGRALRNAGAKRHLIRWAIHELRCPVCESRVKPVARRASALPRSSVFNQVVGVDLVDFSDLGIQMTLMNVV